jgi:hypothetical protein
MRCFRSLFVKFSAGKKFESFGGKTAAADFLREPQKV